MDDAFLVDHRIAVRRQGAAQCEAGVEPAVLIEVHDAEMFRSLNRSRFGLKFAL